jgi:hypothetical protein
VSLFLFHFFCSNHTSCNGLFDQDSRWNDVNVVSSLLKLFFRRLPDSLLTSELYPQFIEADKIEDPAKRVVAIKKLVMEHCICELLGLYMLFWVLVPERKFCEMIL